MRKALFVIACTFCILVIFYILFFLYKPKSVLDFYLTPGDHGEQAEDEVSVDIIPYLYSLRLTDTERYKTDLTWSPDQRYLAFYERVLFEVFEREWALKIINPRTFWVKIIFIGNYHTSRYEWVGDHIVRIFVNAGTGADVYADFDASTLETYDMSDPSSNSSVKWLLIKRY